MNCPYCNEELEETSIEECMFSCQNGQCLHNEQKRDGFIGTEGIWQELAKTKQALDMAITELKNFSEDKEFSIRTWQLSAKDKLKQIESITKGSNNE